VTLHFIYCYCSVVHLFSILDFFEIIVLVFILSRFFDFLVSIVCILIYTSLLSFISIRYISFCRNSYSVILLNVLDSLFYLLLISYYFVRFVFNMSIFLAISKNFVCLLTIFLIFFFFLQFLNFVFNNRVCLFLYLFILICNTPTVELFSFFPDTVQS
jgi:hypothetical protein